MLNDITHPFFWLHIVQTACAQYQNGKRLRRSTYIQDSFIVIALPKRLSSLQGFSLPECIRSAVSVQPEPSGQNLTN
ncbi:hypothetical protein DL545_15430 [Escherichia coli]|nr:hypothetical protein DL545_15430 [Escherichia coli]